MLNKSTELKVLDTFKMKDAKIFLKEFHVQRSFEACQFLNSKIQKTFILKIYDFLEKDFVHKVLPNQIIRLLIAKNLQHEIQIVEKLSWPEEISLQLISVGTQVVGLGPQNFKWSKREYWDEVFKTKNSSADDIIGINFKNEITETSRCNLFFYDEKQDLVFTPSLESGCINGVYRRFVMHSHKIALPDLGVKTVQEAQIEIKNLKFFKIYVANSVREVLKAKLIT